MRTPTFFSLSDVTGLDTEFNARVQVGTVTTPDGRYRHSLEFWQGYGLTCVGLITSNGHILLVARVVAWHITCGWIPSPALAAHFDRDLEDSEIPKRLEYALLADWLLFEHLCNYRPTTRRRSR